MQDIVQLRSHLFDALNRLAEADGEAVLEIEMSKSAAIVQVAETLIRTAEVENKFIAISNSCGSGFIPAAGGVKTKAKAIENKTPAGCFDVDDKKNWVAEA